MRISILLLPLCFSLPLLSQEIAITFESGNLTLDGTLTLPDGAGPFPCVVLVHGSGPNDRDQTVTLNDPNSACLYPQLLGQTIRNFKDISDYLANCGIASLRYDKRTFTHPAILDPVTISPYDFIEDVVAAINYVYERPEISPQEIFLAGHSQGSTLIPVAAKTTGVVRGLISLAGPTTPIDSLLPEQYRYLYEFCANNPILGASVANQFYNQFQQIRNGTFPENSQILINIPGNPNNPIPFGYETFWSDWIDLADSVIINYNSTSLPVLIIHGDQDLNVPIEDVEDFESGLTTDELSISLHEGINHFLTPQNVGAVDTALLSVICIWINDLTTSTIEVSDLEPIRYQASRGALTITLPEQHHFSNFDIADLHGRVLKKQKIISARINIQNLNTGVYIISFWGDNNRESIKVWVP